MQKNSKSQISKIFPKNGEKNCEFILGAHNAWQFPQSTLNEFAFIGASNVGKSSLVNALTAQKVAIVSNTPGRTRQVNFFMLANKVMIVDMPGYGFAKAQDKHIEHWQQTCFEYFSNRQQLKRVFLLIDAIKGLKENDFDIIDLFNELNVSFQIVLTKCDKTKLEELQKIKDEILQRSQLWPSACQEIITCSSKKNQGLEGIKNAIIALNNQ